MVKTTSGDLSEFFTYHAPGCWRPRGCFPPCRGARKDEAATFVDGQGPAARFNGPSGITVDAAGHILVADGLVLRRVSKTSEVSMLAGRHRCHRLAGLAIRASPSGALQLPLRPGAGGQRRDHLAATDNNSIRVVTPGGAVRTLAQLAGRLRRRAGRGRALLLPNGPGAGQRREHSGGRHGKPRRRGPLRRTSPREQCPAGGAQERI